MSKPAGKCVFCGKTKKLTKGHIWPDSFGKILPSNAQYYEQKIGSFNTFESTIPGPSKWERVGTGPLQKRRPRNTCIDCNTGWMSIIESAALPIVRPLILGEISLIYPISKFFLAAVLSLISTRIEFTAHGMRTIPVPDKEFLMNTLLPSDNWRIWIARHVGKDLRDYAHRYTAMQVESQPTAKFGPEYCNTHVSTLIAGQLYVHILFSTVWPDFPGYIGVRLTQIWPPNDFIIDTAHLPEMPEADGIELHETISRLGKTGGL